MCLNITNQYPWIPDMPPQNKVLCGGERCREGGFSGQKITTTVSQPTKNTPYRTQAQDQGHCGPSRRTWLFRAEAYDKARRDSLKNNLFTSAHEKPVSCLPIELVAAPLSTRDALYCTVRRGVVLSPYSVLTTPVACGANLSAGPPTFVCHTTELYLRKPLCCKEAVQKNQP